jgi:TPR repeat protein
MESPDLIIKAAELVQSEQWSLARTYLAPALIDPRLSDRGRSRAYYLSGYSYYGQGLLVSASKDYARALEFDPENTAALAALGGLYLRGEGVPPDETLAFMFFAQAAELGDEDAELNLAWGMLEGRGVEQDLEAARRILQAHAEAGSPRAMLYLGRSYRDDLADDPDPAIARSWYEKAADAGLTEATVALAYMHYSGELGAADPEIAARLFEAASVAGSPAADAALGHMYLTGEGVPMDPSLARTLLERAAEAGNLGGSLSLGHMFEAGIGVDQDLNAAEHWYLQGARAGFGQAQLRLFYLLLLRGEEAQAMEWIARAAEQDLPQAQNDYAWMLSTSRSDALRDGELAVEYAERAVAQVQSAAYLDTLAAAYAELGRFADAVTTQERALALVTEAGSEEAAALTERLAAYRDGQPWRE